MLTIMAKKNKSKPAPMMIGNETFGQRMARIRKAKGYTQIELAQKMDIIQVLISDYECDKLRPYHEMIVRLAKALDISTDELLGVKPVKTKSSKVSLKLQRRMQKIDVLPPAKQKIILQTIDTFIKGVEAQ
ncbi:MAG: helix-turn-helix transcriptional regulator [Desulfobacteraceae bacterium]|jgi:transcriptional regulator with XRE-family HTH domain